MDKDIDELLGRPPTKEERKRHKETVNAILDPDRNANWLKWKYRAVDAYDKLGNIAKEGKYFAAEARDFARYIGKAVKPGE